MGGWPPKATGFEERFGTELWVDAMARIRV